MKQQLILILTVLCYNVVLTKKGSNDKLNIEIQFPTRGEVWPKLKQQERREYFYIFPGNVFSIKMINFETYPERIPIKGVRDRFPKTLTMDLDNHSEQLYQRNHIAEIKKFFRLSIQNLRASCQFGPWLKFSETCPLHPVNHKCNLLQSAVQRFRVKLRKLYSFVTPQRNQKSQRNRGFLKKLNLNLTVPCETKPHLNMDEYYEISVNITVNIFSKSVWGIIRGLESLIQMFYVYDKMLVIDGNKVTDYPDFQHRGLMLDTARNYISPRNIMATLDAMAMNKMNVFHWHIVDDESYPYKSKVFPELSEKGAFNKEMVYNATVIIEINQYALVRGIRMIAEFNMPGHSRALRKSHPDVITDCYENGNPVSYGPMKPFVNYIYDFLSKLIYEISLRFSDEFTHLGGNDVDVDCWKSNPVIRKDLVEVEKFFRAKITYNDVIMFFVAVVSIILKEVRRIPTKIIVWQDVIEAVRTPSILNVFKNNSILYVQMYKNPVPKVHQHVYKVIYSVPWDVSDSDNTFSMMYTAQPHLWNTNKTVGGEALVWTQNIDDPNLMPRVWMKASAVAEVLWNPEPAESMSEIPSSVFERLEEHTIRMKNLGISVKNVETKRVDL